MIKNRTIFTGDNLDILRGMDDESIDLVYLDPPFNSNRNYSAPIGSEAAGSEFKDLWTFEDTDAAWWGELAEDHPSLWAVINAAGVVGGKGDKSYLIYMAMRLLELKRVLKLTGSIYLHCDPTMSHSLKMMMDAIFGKKNFRREIIWSIETSSGYKAQAKNWIRGHDTIHYYSKSKDLFFNKQFFDLDIRTIKRYDKIDEKGKKYKIYFNKDKTERRVYLENSKGRPLTDTWTDIIGFQTVNRGPEFTGYPTQKPLALLKRIILASCPDDGIILDPFCGCATTCIAAEDEGRKWIGIDISEKAVELVKLRAEGRFSLFPVIHRKDIPTRNASPRSKDIKHTLYGKQEGICRGCKCYFEFRNFEVDHIIPRKKGGIDSNGNLQLLCGHCNRVKGARPQEYLLAEIAKRK